MDEYFKTIQQLETMQSLLKGIAQDFMNASNILEEKLNKVKDPLYLMTCNNIGEELHTANNAIMIHTLMANNKVAALNELFGKKGENNERSE